MTDFWAFAEKHIILFELLALLVMAILVVEILRGRRSRIEIDPNTAVRWLNHEHALLLDVRNAYEFNEIHALNALSLPNATFEDVEKKLHKNKSKPCILMCDSASQQSKTLKLAERLTQSGYRVRVLKNGINAWIKEQFPVVKKEST